MKQLFARFLKDESGASLVEYILIAAVVGLGAIAGMTFLRNQANTAMNSAGTALTTSPP
jgi:pilus assembly protein Flp/PilA